MEIGLKQWLIRTVCRKIRDFGGQLSLHVRFSIICLRKTRSKLGYYWCCQFCGVCWTCGYAESTSMAVFFYDYAFVVFEFSGLEYAAC